MVSQYIAYRSYHQPLFEHTTKVEAAVDLALLPLYLLAACAGTCALLAK